MRFLASKLIKDGFLGCTHTAASCGQSGHKRTAEEIKGNKYNNDK